MCLISSLSKTLIPLNKRAFQAWGLKPTQPTNRTLKKKGKVAAKDPAQLQLFHFTGNVRCMPKSLPLKPVGLFKSA